MNFTSMLVHYFEKGEHQCCAKKVKLVQSDPVTHTKSSTSKDMELDKIEAIVEHMCPHS